MNPAEKAQAIQSITEGNSVFRSFDNRDEGVHGTFMLFDDYVPGKIFVNHGRDLVLDNVNYDVYRDKLVVWRDGVEVLVNTAAVKGFSLEGAGGELEFIKVVSGDKEGFFQSILVTDKLALYKKYSKKLIKPDYKDPYSSGRTYSEFISEEKFVLQVKDQPMVGIKNKKDLYQVFPRQKKELAEVLRNKKTDFKNTADVRALFHYLDGILP